ncbi:DUF2939 domain-containing protein [Brevundimonas sp.]|uniref:DUF2939 domain-containing protein n=1 Tax=Brevundimonas sp. TaxID=1871086 RepID=UPI003BACC13C
MSPPDHPTPDAYQPVWARSVARKASREPSFKALILNILAVAVVAAVVAFFAAPAVAFFGIRAAAEAGDVAGLSRLIDFDAVRASLRPQISRRPEILTPPPSILQDPIGAIRRQFEDTVAPVTPGAPPVDAWLSPTALLVLTAGEARADAPPSAASSAIAVQNPPLPRPAYWSINRARLAVAGQDGSRTLFTFERRAAFEWKLVHVGLPGALPSTQP